MMKTFELLIIGCGAAGLMAAASVDNLVTLVIEKNGSGGKKVLISGKGQCNFTHDETLSEMVNHYGSHKNFVKHGLGQWSPERTREWFKNRGVDSFVDENGKVFPKSLKAGDLVEVLMNEALNQGVEFHFKEMIESIEQIQEDVEAPKSESEPEPFEPSQPKEIYLVKTNQGIYRAANILIATGGFTYAVTGSDGDGYKFAKMLGHSIVTPRASLAPIYHSVQGLKALSGVSIPEAQISHLRNGKTLGKMRGDLLFTHKGLSGPVILNNSRDFLAGDVLKLNLTTMSTEALERDLIIQSQTKGKGIIKAYLRHICHSKSIADQMAELLGINEQLAFSEMSKELRTNIVKQLTQFEVPIDQVGGRQIGMATAGGVALDEVKAKNMSSKIKTGLYFAGEVLDVDGDTGGYNIQWAFSSAVSAVSDIKAKCHK